MSTEQADIHYIKRLSQARRLCDGEGRRRREAALVSVKEVASVLGVIPMTLLRWETGANSPRTDVALRWLQVLEALDVHD